MTFLLYILIILASYQTILASNPLRDPEMCGPSKCTATKKFIYHPNVDYLYKYKANVTTWFYGTNSNATKLLIESDVSFHFLTPCEGIMQIEKTVLHEIQSIDGKWHTTDTKSPRSQEFEASLSEFPLRFSFQDGLIEEICPLDEELSWVLNFKRGILSTLQNTMERFDVDHTVIESDVNGACETHYSLIGPSNTSLVLRKVKELTTCSNRYKQHSVIQTTPYNFQSKYKSVPLMASRSECEIVVDHNVFSKIWCEESHLFQPFSRHNRGAKTTTRQQLILLSETNSSTTPLPDLINRRFTLKFDHRQTPKPTSSELKTSRDFIKSLCRLNAETVEEGFSYAFKKFIQTARALTYEALTQLYARASSHCAAGRKHVKNALPLLGTNNAITVMKDIILRNELSESEVKDWLLAIALTPLPDVDTLTAVGPLLKYQMYKTEAVLAVSAVVHTYIRHHPEGENEPQVLELVYQLEQLVETGCSIKKKTEFNINLLTSLKALGNIGISTSRLNQTLQICIANEMLYLEERIAAIQVHRRLPCELGRHYLIQLVKDPTIDSELRIAAYLEVMRCPSYKLIRSIKEMLLKEEVNQVGSFIMSHLNSIQKSSMPSTVEIQGLLTDVHLQTKFSADARKFSQYFEKSMFHDGFNVGGNIEGSLVFSPKSYIPRSTTLNLTLDLFGESINMLEVTARAEGFERYIESLFGPKGRFSNKKASLGLKIFGNELKYFNFLGKDNIKKLFNHLNPVQQLKNLLAAQEINFERSTMFLDSSYIVPTGLGLPIKLNAIGTAAINFKTSGSFKAADFQSNGHLDIEGDIKPSCCQVGCHHLEIRVTSCDFRIDNENVAVDVIGSMAVDAYYTETNIKIKTNVYSSAAVKCLIKVRGMELISASFSLPKERTEIFSAQSELVIQNKIQDGIKEGRSEGNLCTWDSIEQMLGLRLCLDYQFPNISTSNNTPSFLFTGPVRFNAYAKKTDPSVEKYLMEFKWTSEKNKSLLSFVFDTPGSNTPRQFSTQLEIDSKNKTTLQLALQSASIRWEALGQYVNTDDDKRIEFSLLMNGSKQLTMKLGLSRVEARNGHIYSPQFYLAYNETDIAKLTGAVRREEKKGIAQWHVNLRMLVISVNTTIMGYVKRTDTSFSANITTNYQIKRAKPERIRIDFDLKRTTGKLMENSHGDIKIECTAYPYFNINGSAKYLRNPLKIDFILDLNGSPETENRWKVALAYTQQKTHDVRKLLSSIEITKPSQKIDFKVAVNYHCVGPMTNATASLRYAQGKEIFTSLYLMLPSNMWGMVGTLTVSLPSFTPMVIHGTLQGKTPNEYDIELSVTWFSGLHFTMKGFYQDKSTVKLSNYILKLVLTSDSFEAITFTGKYSRDATEFRIDLEALQNNDTYSMTVKVITPTEEMYETAFELKYKNKIFSGTIEANMRDEKRIKIDLHLDKYRDISISIGSLNLQTTKRFDFEIKWDVNRDPGQKFSIACNFDNPAVRNYSVNAVLSYPGRTVKFIFNGAVKGLNYLALVHFEWSPDSVIEVTSNFIREVGENGQIITLKSELITPFANWKKTTFNMELKILTHVFQLESNVYWQNNQNIIINVYGQYYKQIDYFMCQYNGTLQSSIEGVPSVSSNLMHKQTDTTFKTDLHLQKGPEQLVLIKSDWKINRDDKGSNLTGRIDMISPFQGYTNGTLIGKIVTHGDAEIHGVADLKLEDRHFRIDLDGHITSITENMLILNITTPIPNIFKFTARFGYSEINRHFVAEFRGPNRALGVEILLNLKSFSEFDVILNVETPFEEVQKIAVEGKSRPDYIILKAGFNKRNVGLNGMWMSESLHNFEYKLQIYTPMSGLEYSSVVAKLRKNEDALDFEVSLQVAEAKLGVKVQGATKAPEQVEDTASGSNEESEEANKSLNDDEIKPFYWSGRIEIDSIKYPPIKGTLHIEEKDSVYDAALSLTLPEGTVVVKYQLEMKDYLNMENKIQISTPWESFSEMHTYYSMQVQKDIYNFNVNVKYKNQENWTDIGVLFGYERQFSVKDASKITRVVVNLHSPLEVFKLLHINVSLAQVIDMNAFNFSGKAGENEANIVLALKAEENFVDILTDVNITTHYFYVPAFYAHFTYNFLDVEQRIIRLEVGTTPLIANLDLHVTWSTKAQEHVSVKLNITTAHPKIKNIFIDFDLEKSGNIGDYNIYVIYNEHEMKTHGSLQAQKFEANLTTTFEKYRNFKVLADFNTNESNFMVYGIELHHDEKAYLFEGWSNRTTENLLEMYIKLVSGTKNIQDLILECSLTRLTLDDGYNVTVNLNYTTYRLEVNSAYRRGTNYLELYSDMKTTIPGHDSYFFSAKGRISETQNITAQILLKTPLKYLDNIHLEGSCLVTKTAGSCNISYQLHQMKGFFQGDYLWFFQENMEINLNALMEKEGGMKKHIIVNAFYKNKDNLYENVSFGFNIDQNQREWQIGANATILYADVLQADLIISLPQPYVEVYKVSASLNYPFDLLNCALTLAYDTVEAKIHYGLHAKFEYEDNRRTHVLLGVDTSVQGKTKSYVNEFDSRTRRKVQSYLYRLKTPYYTEDTVKFHGNYTTTANTNFAVRSSLFYPASVCIASMNLDYESLANLKGTVNSTTPFKGLDYAGLTLQVVTQSDRYKRYAMIFWPNNTALLNSDATYDVSTPHTQVNGTLVLEVPVSSRHIGVIDYKYYMADEETRIGIAEVKYNKREVLKSKLRSQETVRKGYERENIYLEIENQLTPIGIRYDHVLQYNPDILKNRLPKKEMYRAEIVKLRNETLYNLTGELEVLTSKTGREIKITAHNPNRTVDVSTEYNITDRQLQHRSMIRVDPQAWISYDLNIVNITMDQETTEKQMEFNLEYPKRNVTLTGFYKLSAMKLTSKMIFYWDKENLKKSIGAVVDWQKLSTKPNKQVASLSIGHPTLEQDIKLSCELYGDERKMLDTKIDLVYSTDETRTLTIFSELLNETDASKKKYKIVVGALHPATNLNVTVEGNVQSDGKVYQTSDYVHYKRLFIPITTREAHVKLDIPEKILEMESKSDKKHRYWMGSYKVTPPIYTASYDTADGTQKKGTGHFHLNVVEYETRLDMNSTNEDSDENLRMMGSIPDARNAVFKIWRDYDGTIIPDVSFYLRLNHSRLITSKFIWRAELPDQLVTNYHEFSNSTWNAIYEDIDFWIQYIKSESIDIRDDIWSDVEYHIQPLLEDLSDIKNVSNDMVLLLTYLNRSYHENQFYIKDIVGFGILLLDELSLRRHFENLPEVVNELWSVMGESGVQLRNNLIRIIETVKVSFEKAVDFLNKFLKGESMFDISQVLDMMMASYDKFVKDLHLTFTIFVDDMWKQMSNTLDYYWSNVQQMIQPVFLQVVHYAELAVFRASNEILNFFYEKQKELRESPYYNKFAIFVRDLDHFWKDFKSNDAYTNFQKYSTMLLTLLREKYFAIVPFGKELEDLMNDLVKELTELQKLSSVNYILQMLNKIYERMEWLYEKLDITTKLKNLIIFLHYRIHEITQTALTAENNNREPKTKFIFEPESGIMEFEQKLPISWHSFNERPNYEEIPEYKAWIDFQNYFVSSNKSLWHYYNEYKPYTDVSNWLPPFKAQAIIAGNQHFVTFDHKLYGFRGECTYQAAFSPDNKLSIFVQYDPIFQYEHHIIIIVLDKDVIKVDRYSKIVQLNEKPHILPFMIANSTFVYRENKIINIENSDEGFKIQCNLEFDICSVELSGWNFGKTYGLLGTIDNEQVTDFTASNMSIVNDIAVFAHSWSHGPTTSAPLESTPLCTYRSNYLLQLKKPDSKIVHKCNSIFANRESALQPCFSVVDPQPYKEMCMTSRIYKENEACASVLAYLKTCQMRNTPVKLPPDCVRCHVQDHELEEYDYIETSMIESNLHSTDVVFIVEAKECNRDVVNKRHLTQLYAILSKELKDTNITQNRFALVTFGGNGVFDEPRTAMTNNEFSENFTPMLFNNIQIGDGNQDIFEALRYAAKLPFRPTVSKTFILMPCSTCNQSDMTFDYPAVLQMLLENDITLHILMNGEFVVNKTRVSKNLFGIDRRTAYTKKDVNKLRGDENLHRQVPTPKSQLGICIPLALETNGTVFTATKLETPPTFKSISTVFAKRVAQTAIPLPCQICECMVDQNSVSSVFCSPCFYPMPMSLGEAIFDEDTSFFHLQPAYQNLSKLKLKVKPRI